MSGRSSTRVVPLALGLLFGTLFGGCGKPADEEVDTAAVVPVTTARAQVGDLQERFAATGVVAPPADGELLVIAPQPARLAAVPFAAGESVRSGDLLVRFDIPALAQELAQRRAEVERGAAHRTEAQAALDRIEPLFEHGVAARREVDQARRDLSDARADLAAAEAARSAAEALARRTEVRAPFAGVIATRWHAPGELVDAANSDPVLRLVRQDRVEIAAEIPAAHAAEVTLSGRAEVFLPNRQAPLAGTVKTRPATIDPATGTATFRIAIEGLETFPLGLTASIELLGPLHRGVVVVPQAALVREGEATSVFVLVAKEAGPAKGAASAKGGELEARKTAVVPGACSRQACEVRSGLQAGQRVVIGGQAGLPDGALVREEAGSASPP